MRGIDHIPFEDYVKLPGVNMSTLLELRISAKHYLHRLTSPRADKDSYKVGRAFHTATLEPRQFLLEYARMPDEFPDAKGNMRPASKQLKSCAAWCEAQEADGKTVLTQAQYDTAWNMAEAVMDDPVAAPYLRAGRHECTIRWTDPRTGIDCKARLDYVSSVLADLKSSRHSIPHAFGRTAARLDYPTRMCWYKDGLRIAKGLDLPVKLITCESFPPYDVVVYDVTEEQLEAGRRVYEPLMDELRVCMDSQQWPGVSQGLELTLQLPPWVTEGISGTDNDLLGMDLDLEGSGVELVS